MKIIHIEGGLGNQMACYAVYKAVKFAHPNEKIYIDTYLYDVKEAHSVISMWNGYELEKVFGVKIPNIRELFTDDQVEEQLAYLRLSQFWEHNWNYAEVFIEMMHRYGYDFKNAYSKVGDASVKKNMLKRVIKTMLRKFGAKAATNVLGYELKSAIHILNKKLSGDCGTYLLEKREGDVFYDITLDFMKSEMLQKTIGQEVRKELCFVEPVDEINQEYINQITQSESVSIHVRRSDYVKFIDDCYRYGYFKKASNYVKSKVEAPCFFLFSDDLAWCRENLDTLGLSQDVIVFVNANFDEYSYRDMRLMACCKHNIITKSSFGWWGSFLNENPNKIVCCQLSQYMCTKQF